MALTDVQTIRKIIVSEQAFVPNIFNEKIIMNLFEDTQLQHVNITSDSETVKSILQLYPAVEPKNPITLIDKDKASLSSSKIVWNSVVVSEDLALTNVYIENKDYILDYFNGTIERASFNTGIPNNSNVYIWFIPFVVYTQGIDYNIDYATGKITRRSNSEIANLQTLYVDYTHAQNSPSDTTINELIIQMENWIAPRLKPAYTLNSDNLGLKAASTNYVLYLFCLQASLNELLVSGKDKSDAISKQWNLLADKYAETAIALFSKYLQTNTLPTGGMIKNRWVQSRTNSSISPAVTPTRRRH